MSDSLHVDAHAAGGAGDGAHRGVEVCGGEIGLLEFGNLFQLLARDLANFGGIGGAAAFFNADRLADEHGRRWRLHEEGEAAVSIDGDHHRNGQALLHLLGLGIELLAQLHDVHALLAQRRPDRGRGIRRAYRHLQLDVALYFLGHFLLLYLHGLKVAYGAFSGHHSVARGPKTWLLPAASHFRLSPPAKNPAPPGWSARES